jgi:hypothetical protein
MASREQMVEKVWQSITAHNLDAWAAAEDAVDAILPQVTTVAELEALPYGAVLVAATGDAYTWLSSISVSINDEGHVSWDSAETLIERAEDDAEGPMTVVWQPEVTS